MKFGERLESLRVENVIKYGKAYKILIPEAVIDFIERYVLTYDPRLEDNKKVPFFLFPKQVEFITWLVKNYQNKRNAMVDKCRDVGATWCFLAFAVYLLIFQSNTSVGLFTYKAAEVDKLGDISTLFGKARFIIENLPEQYVDGITLNYFHIKNELNGSDIAGASGDNPGRGGRRSIVLKDESAFYEHAEQVEAALSEVSNCIIDISTHQGTNTLFYNKIQSGNSPIFTFDWWDNPLHTQSWYNAKKEDANAKGLLHIFQREIERNAGASIENTVIPFDWMTETMKNRVEIHGLKVAGLDVADAGLDANALCVMDGNVLIHLDEWSGVDTGITADRAFWKCVELGVDELRYDNIGVGAGVKAEINRILEKIKEIPAGLRTPAQNKALSIKIVGWSASGAVVNPLLSEYSDKPNGMLFENAKSQAYWKLRDEFRNTFRNGNLQEADKSKLLCFPDVNPNLFSKFKNEICQPQFRLSASGKIIIDKKAKGGKSPNILEALIIARADRTKHVNSIQFGSNKLFG